MIDIFTNSWDNGCCEDGYSLAVYNEIFETHEELTTELYNDKILVKLINPQLYEVPERYYFKL